MLTKNTPLIEAAKQGDTDAIRNAIEEGANINAKDSENWGTALHWAIYNNHLNAVRFLLERGAEVTEKTGEYWLWSSNSCNKTALELAQVYEYRGIEAEIQFQRGYRYENENPPNYNLAVKCYQHAANLKHPIAQNNLGRCYEQGNGVTKDEKAALSLYQKAAEKDYIPARRSKLFLEAKEEKNSFNAVIKLKQALSADGEYPSNDIIYGSYVTRLAQCEEKDLANINPSAEDLHQSGVLYYLIKNYQKAYKWFLKAQEKGSVWANVNLGMLYEKGLGVTKDIVTAARYYQQSIEKGFTDAQVTLDRLLSNATIKELNAIGLMYYNADGVNRDYVKAKLWFEKAKEKGSKKAYIYLGDCYRFSNEGVKNVVIAVRYYQKAIEYGYAQAQEQLDSLFADDTVTSAELIAIGDMYYKGEGVKENLNKARKWYAGNNNRNITHARTQLKEITRDRILNKRNGIDRKDEEGCTPLHRAAEYGQLKNCARLLIFQANKNISNREGKKPFEDLSNEQKEKITRLQTQVSAFIPQLEEKTPSLLARKETLILDNARLDEKATKEVLSDLYEIDEIYPIMKLAKLSALGLHDRSNRTKFSEDGYDSDQDDEEKLSANREEFLKIRLDANSKSIGNISHTSRSSSTGVYTHTNNIYVAGKRVKEAEVLGTLIHELTHFVAEEVFKNNSKPYANDEVTGELLFTLVADDLKNKKNSLDPILQGAFTQHYQEKGKIHNELIVRVAQMIVRYKDEKFDGLARLKKQAPRLLDYYNNVFLPAIYTHIAKLEERALSNWPIELYRERYQKKYSLKK